ncbi:hypothetical protein D7Y27_37315 [Corallococcus sp. AB004]|uniref:hypothetical protein n=1 Tax=Corallococcus sp. AB018 TaxID=2316715 RepID=UPI000EA3AABC|nr:hypothetical protein [Corallococcus sp. AB018]RKI31609.1 hypothetical protein D7Y27_37315 [Corallococcus sp. AB004]RUO87380.1 hypothetical protein D7Y11_40975 [Corallococcus sp. AB018]
MRALSMMTLLWGVVVAAQAAPPLYTMVMTTQPLTGATHDTVVASVVEAGTLRAPTRVPMTLRILDAHDVVLATVTGTVSAGAPLRVSARAPSPDGVRAELVLPAGAEKMAAGVLVLERAGIEEEPPPQSTFCEFTLYTYDPSTGMPEPVTVMGACSLETL